MNKCKKTYILKKFKGQSHFGSLLASCERNQNVFYLILKELWPFLQFKDFNHYTDLHLQLLHTFSLLLIIIT